MRLLITGSRDWTDKDTIESAMLAATWHIDNRHAITVVHGNARGADTLAAQVAAKHGFAIEAHPADWDQHGRGAGAIRNLEMARAGAHICLAFPLGESRGTHMMIGMAREAGIPVFIFRGRT